MKIENTEKIKTVRDYDFTFVNGIPLAITVDESEGDTVRWDTASGVVIFTIAPRTIADSNIKVPGKEFTVFLNHLLAYEIKNREIHPLTPEQQAEMKKFLDALNSPQHSRLH